MSGEGGKGGGEGGIHRENIHREHIHREHIHREHIHRENINIIWYGTSVYDAVRTALGRAAEPEGRRQGQR